MTSLYFRHITEFENKLVKNVAMECKRDDMTEVGSSSHWRFEAKSAGQKTKDGIRVCNISPERTEYSLLRECIRYIMNDKRSLLPLSDVFRLQHGQP